jgi:thiol-disulfide isomerase/thioredoxin
MKIPLVALAITLSLTAVAQSDRGPSDAKAQKTYAEALQALNARQYRDALDKFRKANKQDGGQCSQCLKKIAELASELGDFKAADAASRDLITGARGPEQLAQAHYDRGTFLLREAMAKNKSEFFAESDQEFKQALTTRANDVKSIYADGLALAHMKQDAAAKAQFERAAELSAPGSVDRSRSQRYAERPELARARMAPAFALVASNGQRVSMDDLTGKVVLIDFWATWCGPCREALPHMKRIAQKFSGEPLVVLSVSLDDDEKKWSDFVVQHEMTWLQYRDGGFEGQLARMFGVTAIPHTFTIDADGVLQDEHIGDASIEGKLKKLIAQARQRQAEHAAQQQAAN